MTAQRRGLVITALAAGLFGIAVATAQQQAPTTPPIALDADDLGGIVRSARGPEAGVWVIAETTALPTRLRRIVVTDDQGRYVVPDLPRTSYSVWVRGYGLVDSPKVQAVPGRALDLTAVVAPDARAAAEYYPANYWYSLIQVPPTSEFPGTGESGNGIDPGMRSQAQWIHQMKANCEVCHQLGTKATREFPRSLGSFESHLDAWDRRVEVGQDAPAMIAGMNAFGRRRAVAMFADWTERIAAGELPPAPPRPQGVERNVVITQWDWGVPSSFVHDEVATDKRRPTANANGPVYGIDYGNDLLLIADPARNSVQQLRIPVRDADTPPQKPQTMPRPSPYWGEEIYWTDPSAPNNLMMDSRGRVWFAATIRPIGRQPAACAATHPSAALAPLKESRRHAGFYDPATGQFTLIDTCFDTHHVRFGSDADETVYFNGIRGGTIGWIRTRELDRTGDQLAAQGWCKGYFDTNADGRLDPAVDRPVDMAGVYSVIPNPADGTVWGAVPGAPGRIIRMDPRTCITEAYEPPFENPRAPGKLGSTPRGIDIDTNGVIWTALAGSGHLASFDRRKCTVLTGAAAMTGQHCPEGWTLYATPGPRMKGVTDEINADFHYFNWVDQFDALGLGRNTPMANGSGSDSLLALQPNGEWVVLRVPYPLGFFTRGLDGRIDDAGAGWKGRGVWANYGPNALWHTEGGRGTLSAVVKFQIRPNPLAK